MQYSSKRSAGLSSGGAVSLSGVSAGAVSEAPAPRAAASRWPGRRSSKGARSARPWERFRFWAKARVARGWSAGSSSPPQPAMAATSSSGSSRALRLSARRPEAAGRSVGSRSSRSGPAARGSIRTASGSRPHRAGRWARGQAGALQHLNSSPVSASTARPRGRSRGQSGHAVCTSGGLASARNNSGACGS